LILTGGGSRSSPSSSTAAVRLAPAPDALEPRLPYEAPGNPPCRPPADAPLCIRLLHDQLHGLDDGRGAGQLDHPRPRRALRLAKGPEWSRSPSSAGRCCGSSSARWPTHIGAKKTTLIGLALTLVPLLMGWLWSDSLSGGPAGRPLAGRGRGELRRRRFLWRAAGIRRNTRGWSSGSPGRANVSTALSAFFGPWVASSWGWHAAFGIVLVPVLATLAWSAFLAEDGRCTPRPKHACRIRGGVEGRRHRMSCASLCRHVRWLRGAGEFPGHRLSRQYALTNVQAGALAHACALIGSQSSPLGRLSVGSARRHRVLTWVYLGVAATMAGVSALPALGVCTLLLVTA